MRERDRQFAAVTIYCEASSEPAAVWTAIAHVLLNRVADGRWANNTAGVCCKRMQFSEFNDDKVNNANLERGCAVADDDSIWLGCLSAYDQAANCETTDPTDGATHFYDVSIPPPAWTVGATFTAQIGSTRFFKNVK